MRTIPYPWEKDLKPAYVGGKCEWGYPEMCGKEAVFVFDPFVHSDKTGYPMPLYACRDHFLDLRTGAEPRVIRQRGEKQ